jgi:hypothetical protein
MQGQEFPAGSINSPENPGADGYLLFYMDIDTVWLTLIYTALNANSFRR